MGVTSCEPFFMNHCMGGWDSFCSLRLRWCITLFVGVFPTCVGASLPVIRAHWGRYSVWTPEGWHERCHSCQFSIPLVQAVYWVIKMFLDSMFVYIRVSTKCIISTFPPFDFSGYLHISTTLLPIHLSTFPSKATYALVPTVSFQPFHRLTVPATYVLVPHSSRFTSPPFRPNLHTR